MMYDHEMTYELDLKYTVEIEPFVPGKYTGPPEDCYPDEGGYASLTKVWITKKTHTKAPDGSDLYIDFEIPLAAISDEMREELEKAAYESYCESCGE